MLYIKTTCLKPSFYFSPQTFVIEMSLKAYFLDGGGNLNNFLGKIFSDCQQSLVMGGVSNIT